MITYKELKEKFEICQWRKNGHSKCKNCLADCDLMNLPYDSKSVLQRIKEETKYIKEHHKDKELKEKVKDKAMGIVMMSKALYRLKRLRK